MLRVRTVFTGMQGAPWLSTAHFDDVAASAQDCVDAVGAFWGAVDSLMDNEVDWATQPDVEVVNPVNGQVTGIETTSPLSASGAQALEALPFATQGLIRWRTGVFVAGREIRGRTFVPGMVETGNDNGRPGATAISAMNSSAIGLITDASTTFGIWSPARGQIAAVASGTAWSEFAVLRSRRD